MTTRTVTVHQPSTERTTTGPIGEVHTTLQGWFAGDDLDTLAAVDQLALAIEAGRDVRHALAAGLGLTIDEHGGD